MDGARGPYCLMMSMVMLNMISKNDLPLIDKRYNAGRFFAALDGLPGLIRNGTTVDDLAVLAKQFSKARIHTDQFGVKNLYDRLNGYR
ncbi:MAG: hypothetical protein HQM03_10205 [Magnetococcales bacterium]|nr:hypothetical protein [Magnetococcales bacterium]